MTGREAAELNSAFEKYASSLSKVRPSEDKTLKALPAWTEPEVDEDEDSLSEANLVNVCLALYSTFFCRSFPFWL